MARTTRLALRGLSTWISRLNAQAGGGLWIDPADQSIDLPGLFCRVVGRTGASCVIYAEYLKVRR